MIFKFPINPLPKVRMTGRSTWGDPRARVCMEYQQAVANLARFERVPQFGKALVGFSKLKFVRFGRSIDIDNALKSFFDGLEYAGVFDNDNQIRVISNLSIEYTKEPNEAVIEFEIYDIIKPQ